MIRLVRAAFARASDWFSPGVRFESKGEVRRCGGCGEPFRGTVQRAREVHRSEHSEGVHASGIGVKRAVPGARNRIGDPGHACSARCSALDLGRSRSRGAREVGGAMDAGSRADHRLFRGITLGLRVAGSECRGDRALEALERHPAGGSPCVARIHGGDRRHRDERERCASLPALCRA